MNKDDVGRFLDCLHWIEAKTYAEWAPHQYALKDKEKPELRPYFAVMAQWFRDYGFHAYFGKTLRSYYEYNGMYYWTMDNPVEVTGLINRCYIDEYCMKYKGHKQLKLEGIE